MRKTALSTLTLMATLAAAAPGAAQTRDACLDAARALTGSQARWEDTRGRDTRRDGNVRWVSADGSSGRCRLDSRGAVYEVRVDSWGRGPWSGGRPGSGYPGNGQPGTGANRYGLTEEFGYDRRGADYSSTETRTLSACQAACRDDARCLAYTFSAQQGRCWLKSRVHEAQASRDMVTGYKLADWANDGGSGWGSLTEEWDLDRRGNDYQDYRADSLGECKQECLDDNRCRAYTFDTRTRTCYLKDRANAPLRNEGMVTGYKQ